MPASSQGAPRGAPVPARLGGDAGRPFADDGSRAQGPRRFRADCKAADRLAGIQVGPAHAARRGRRWSKPAPRKAACL